MQFCGSLVAQNSDSERSFMPSFSPNFSETNSMKLHRRTCLKAAGVSVALPAMDAMSSANAATSVAEATPQRMVTICTTLGLHAPSLFPAKTGADYELTEYLKPLADHRKQMTLFSGLSHPDQAGANGHSSQMTWLTAARHPGLGGFRNSISVDQFVREKLGYVTRFPSLSLSTNGTSSQSYTRSGVMIPAEYRPSVVFQNLFMQGQPDEVKRQKQKLTDGQSILDSLGDQTRRLRKKISAADAKRLDEYFSSIRSTENQFVQASEWLNRPKPQVDSNQPSDIANDSDLIGRMQLLMQLVPLVVQTDSSRMISIVVHGRSDVPLVDGVSVDHHNLSHHGQDEEKIAQLKRIESKVMHGFADLLTGLSAKEEQGRSLLDGTMVLFGSNLGNANAHDWRNLPIIAAGGDFNHGRYVAYDKDDNKPLSNLFVSMLQKLNIETDHFATSTGRLTF